MPYIDPNDAAELRASGNFVPPSLTPGELNYFLSCTIAQYVTDNGLSYQTINDVSGAMTEALAEFRRQIVVDYENFKALSGADPYAGIRHRGDETDEEWVFRVNESD